MKLGDLIVLSLLLVILGFVLAMGQTVITDLQQTQCTGGTVGIYSGSDSAHPDGGYYGCCTSINASDTTDCDTWSVSYALNTSQVTLEGIDTIAGWQDTIALVIIFAVIISLLIGFVFKGAMQSRG